MRCVCVCACERERVVFPCWIFMWMTLKMKVLEWFSCLTNRHFVYIWLSLYSYHIHAYLHVCVHMRVVMFSTCHAFNSLQCLQNSFFHDSLYLPTPNTNDTHIVCLSVCLYVWRLANMCSPHATLLPTFFFREVFKSQLKKGKNSQDRYY